MKARASAAGRLVVVATPIGNLDDLSPRARDALKGAHAVYAEDTRHSRPLLDRAGFTGALVSCHAHNEDERTEEVVARVHAGEIVALISDAGAPALSDPGGRIIGAVADAGLTVEVIPGPSAVVAALMGAGVDASRFAFLGFLPRTGKERERIVVEAANAGLALVIYEAPNRTDETLADLHTWLGPRRVVVARELTKMHETFHRGVLGSSIKPALVEKGELVIVVEAGEAGALGAGRNVDVDAIAKDTSLPPKERAKQIAKALGISTKDAYARVLSGESGAAPDIAAVLGHLADAARALVDAERAAGQVIDHTGHVDSEIDGADGLLRLLEQRPRLRAPVEVHEVTRAILAALGAADALQDALEFETQTRPKKK